MDSESKHTATWRVPLVAILLVGLAFLGPANGAALSIIETSCCDGSTSLDARQTSTDAIVGVCGTENLRAALGDECCCSGQTCQICQPELALHQRQTFTSESIPLDIGGTRGSRSLSRLLANPPRAPSERPDSVRRAQSPDRRLHLAHQVLLI